ncbi:MAG TPA: hypothetical protein DDZ96_05110 [Porphyromonadaceae bacterium]|jgi:hypothetical protein|nr:hypothetical protein [Porphyromonadaceae bacterium]
MNKMMITMAVVLLAFLASCGNASEKKTNKEEQTETAAANDVAVYPLDSLLAHADELVGQTVKVRGHVTHTCKHSGKRCFLAGNDENASLRVEAGGEIGGFNRELVGSELEIKGVVRERKLTQEYISQYEKDVEAQKTEEDGSAETCQAELNNIESMRQWMKTNQKEYYPIYYMDGEAYEVVEE